MRLEKHQLFVCLDLDCQELKYTPIVAACTFVHFRNSGVIIDEVVKSGMKKVANFVTFYHCHFGYF